MGYSVNVWTTKSLHELGNGDPEQALDDYLTKALEETGYSASVDVKSHHPDPPNESLEADDEWPIWATNPCTGDSKEYHDLLEWWGDYHNCKNLGTAKDANMLVSYYGSTAGVTTGGCSSSSGPFLLVAEGSEVGELINYPWDAKGDNLRFSQMYATVIHEMGHSAIDDSYADCTGTDSLDEEQMGHSYYDSSLGMNITSPMVTWTGDGNDGDNECCENLGTVDYEPKGFERPYSNGVKDHSYPC
jgi:hypothetical protein